MFEFDTPSAISPEEYAKFLDSAKAEREAHAASKYELDRMTSLYWSISDEMAYTRTELAAVTKSLATAERDRDRWKAIHDREWDVEIYPNGECSIFDPREKSGIYHIVDYSPTLEAALDAAFALHPLKPKC